MASAFDELMNEKLVFSFRLMLILSQKANHLILDIEQPFDSRQYLLELKLMLI